ncbi:leucine-rich repeat extensin-like protein 3 [Momordica charantia]|uniref:Leucine-rich repeat extensin-like protein 3 n=1 Tax=Momordica charantia TaxID=3673 RepID=A0A6J1CIP8_MOMCH|nr:leucine-rich repeat extensin-like protein 3 [Momordica charantia]
MGCATAILIAWVCLNVSTKLSAQHVHPSSPPPAAPPPIVSLFPLPPKKHKQLQWSLPPVAEPIVPYFPFVYIPSPSVKPYEHTSPPPPSPVAVAEPIVPYFPFVYIPSPSVRPYEHTSPPPPSPVAVAEPIVPYFPFTFTPSPSEEPYEHTPPPPSAKCPYRSPLNHLPPGVLLREKPPWPPNFTVKTAPPPF